jgi:acyl-CoA thioesterase-2
MWQKYGHLQNEKRASWLLQRPFDFRYVEGDIMVERPEPSPVQHVWMRATDEIGEDELLNRAALAFGSDYLLVEPVARAHGLSWSVPGLKAASLDHSMWFHRPIRVDEWLMYALESPTSQGGRGLSHGKFYNREGDLVASVSQEVMLRTP